MSNGEVCCLLGVCCPAGSAQQLTALAAGLRRHHTEWTEQESMAAAERVLTHYGDFADVPALLVPPEATPDR